MARRHDSKPKIPFQEFHEDDEVLFPQVVSVWCVNISGVKLKNGWGADASDSEFDSDGSDCDSDSSDSDDDFCGPPQKKQK